MSSSFFDITDASRYVGGMTVRSVFPLRFSTPRLRELVRMLAEREGVSQNVFIEQAVEHESLIRGAMVADDLAQSSRRIAALTEAQHRTLLDNAIAAFAAGEAQPDPVQATALHSGRDNESGRRRDALGVLAAFETAGT